MAWIGANTIENEGMSFHNYFISPTKLLNSVTFVGIGDFMMASIFAGSTMNSPPLITYHKYTKDC
jgi:hypothetical protein